MLSRSPLSMNPNVVQHAWARFDDLGNFQAASLLVAALLGMLATAVCLLIGARLLVPGPAPSQAARVAPVQVPPVAGLQPQRTAPVHLRALTIPPSVNLRAEPTTAAQSLAVLPQNTELELLGDDEGAHDGLWRHVRTDDGREGWIIVTALD